MSILKLTPSCKDYLWGGSRLRTDFGVQSDLNPLAEAWVLSCHPDGPSYLPDGTMLADYLAAHPEARGKGVKPGVDLGTKLCFGTIAHTICDYLGVDASSLDGQSVLPEILK